MVNFSKLVFFITNCLRWGEALIFRMPIDSFWVVLPSLMWNWRRRRWSWTCPRYWRRDRFPISGWRFTLVSSCFYWVLDWKSQWRRGCLRVWVARGWSWWLVGTPRDTRSWWARRGCLSISGRRTYPISWWSWWSECLGSIWSLWRRCCGRGPPIRWCCRWRLGPCSPSSAMNAGGSPLLFARSDRWTFLCLVFASAGSGWAGLMSR